MALCGLFKVMGGILAVRDNYHTICLHLSMTAMVAVLIYFR